MSIGKEFENLVHIVKRLRSDKGCPWDRKQKIRNLQSYLLEETYELLDSLNTRKYQNIKEELGDLLLIVVFICQIYTEKDIFKIEDVIKCINTKLVRRHPHVFGDKKLKTPSQVWKEWLKIKTKENKTNSIPKNLPSLLWGYKTAKYLRKTGKYRLTKKDCKIHLKKVFKEFLKHPTKKSIQNLLFGIIYLSTFYNLEPETVLRAFLLQLNCKTQIFLKDK